MKVVLLLTVIVGVVFSQVPTPCHSPSQWEAREIRIDYSQKYEERRHLYYDEENLRMRTFGEVELGSDREFYDTLYLYKENKNYTISLRNHTCRVSPLAGNFRYRGVHPNARFDTLVSLGATGIPGESIQVALFSANETNEFYTGIVTYPACLPVQNIHVSKQYGFEHSDYYDLTIGISDPAVFVPPPECNGL